MSWRSSGRSHLELLRNLQTNKIIKSAEVFDAMSKVDRARYCTEYPYEDRPQSIGFGATISAPHMHAFALEYLKDQLKPHRRALDVGSGSGYLSVCMAYMVKATEGQGMVVGIDYKQGLVDLSVKNVERDIPSLLASPNFKLVKGDGWKGAPEFGPFDAIHVGAAAAEIPQALVEQLAPGGRMIIPVGPPHSFSGQELLQITKDAHGNVEKKNLFAVAYVPLVKPYD